MQDGGDIRQFVYRMSEAKRLETKRGYGFMKRWIPRFWERSRHRSVSSCS